MSPCNKPNCCRNKTPQNQPREEMSIQAVVAIAAKIVQQLSVLKSAGITLLPEEISVTQLSNTLQALLAENNSLRFLLDRVGAPFVDVNATATTATIVFGPQQKYTLKLNLNSQHERELLAAEFRAAADTLLSAPPTAQQELPVAD
jgi:Tfp pilus assembly PilM family ATPase